MLYFKIANGTTAIAVNVNMTKPNGPLSALVDACDGKVLKLRTL